MFKVNINTAPAESLRLVSGIGEKKANAIIKHRQIYGKVTKEAFALMFLGEIPDGAWELLDFTEPSRSDVQSFEGGRGQGHPSLTRLKQKQPNLKLKLRRLKSLCGVC